MNKKFLIILFSLFMNAFCIGNSSSFDLESSLHDAIESCNVKRVGELIKKGASLESVVLSQTPLSRAVELYCYYHGNGSKVFAEENLLPIIDLLIGAGSPMDFPFDSPHPSYIWSPLALATQDARLFNKLINAGAQPNSRGVLLKSVQDANLPMVQQLLKWGVEYYDNAWPLLAQATHAFQAWGYDNNNFESCKKIIKELIDAGYEVNWDGGNSILNCVFVLEDEGLFDLSIAKGADVNARDSDFRTPLHRCAENADSKMIMACERLLSLGADCNAQDINGNNPLHQLVTSFAIDWLHYRSRNSGVYEEMLQFFLNAGVDFEMKNNNDQTPLQILESYNVEGLVPLLKKAARGYKGDSVFDWFKHVFYHLFCS